MENYNSITLLKYYLNQFEKKYKFNGDETNKIIQILKNCWSIFAGSEQENTHPDKLDRAEKITWNPPILTFVIERHGATVNGSTRASLHYWRVDLERKTAQIVRKGQRQLKKIDQRMDTNKLAQDVAHDILNNTNKPTLIWDSDYNYVVIVISEIIPETIKQTTQARRKRFRIKLIEIMQNHNWVKINKGNRIGFLRPS